MPRRSAGISRSSSRPIGLPLIEGYGLTEGGVVTLNPIDIPKAGKHRQGAPGCRSEDRRKTANCSSRVHACSPATYKDPEATAAVLTDGWLHTGDIAEIDAEGLCLPSPAARKN